MFDINKINEYVSHIVYDFLNWESVKTKENELYLYKFICIIIIIRLISLSAMLNEELCLW